MAVRRLWDISSYWLIKTLHCALTFRIRLHLDHNSRFTRGRGPPSNEIISNAVALLMLRKLFLGQGPNPPAKHGQPFVVARIPALKVHVNLVGFLVHMDYLGLVPEKKPGKNDALQKARWNFPLNSVPCKFYLVSLDSKFYFVSLDSRFYFVSLDSKFYFVSLDSKFYFVLLDSKLGLVLCFPIFTE